MQSALTHPIECQPAVKKRLAKNYLGIEDKNIIIHSSRRFLDDLLLAPRFSFESYLMLTFLTSKTGTHRLSKEPIQTYSHTIFDFGRSRLDHIFSEEVQSTQFIVFAPETPGRKPRIPFIQGKLGKSRSLWHTSEIEPLFESSDRHVE